MLDEDIVIGKDMLHEGGGSGLEEVLLAFSSLVLNQVMTEELQDKDYVAKMIEDFYSDQRNIDYVNALGAAFKASAARQLAERRDDAALNQQMNGVLRKKRAEVAQREATASKVQQDLQGIGSEIDSKQMEKDLAEASNVPREWIQELVYGGKTSDVHQKAFSCEDLEQMKRMVIEKKQLSPKGERPSGLVKQLDDRIQEQKNRLSTWQTFRDELEKRKSRSNKHTAASQNRQQVAKEGSTHRKNQTPADLATTPTAESKYGRPTKEKTLTILPKAEKLVANTKGVAHQQSATFGNGMQKLGNFEERADMHDTMQDATLKLTDRESLLLQEEYVESSAPTKMDSHSDSAAPRDSTVSPNFPSTPVAHGKKAHLSLTERTRLSMAPLAAAATALPSSSLKSVVQQEQRPISANVGLESMPSSTEPPKEQSERSGTNLTERTRQSLSFLPSPAFSSKTTRIQKQTGAMSNAKRKVRLSQFPVNQFDTPSKMAGIQEGTEIKEMEEDLNTAEDVFSKADIDNEGTTGKGTTSTSDKQASGKRNITPRESLFSEGAEYSSIFKSRPRVAVSPVLTPIKGSDEDGGGMGMSKHNDIGLEREGSPLKDIA